MLFKLAGARSLILTDIERLMDRTTIAHAKAVLATRISEISTMLGRPLEELLAALAEPFEPKYLVPWQIETHPDESADLIISRAAFEHVPPPRLAIFSLSSTGFSGLAEQCAT